jgi:hypothetical protein
MPEKLIKNTLYTTQLTAVVVLNLAAFLVLCKRGIIAVEDIPAMAKDWRNIAVPGVSGFLVIALNYICDHVWKARLVFWRWRNPLPGSRAFSEHARDDPRIDVTKLKEKLGSFPREASKQNALWYRLYRTVESRSEVLNVHKHYLFLRDWACITILLILFLVPASFLICPSTRTRLLLIALLGSEYFLVRLAAANAGRRFVMTVLAIKAAEPESRKGAKP